MSKKIDIKGQQFGYLTVLRESKERKDGEIAWVCKCVCGNEIVVRGKCLRQRKTQSCGCKKSQLLRDSKYIDLTGHRFGRLVVTGFSNKTENRIYYWKCQCDCGNEIVASGNNLKSGNTKSCGCLNKEKMIETHKTHGMFGTRIYGIWNGLIMRCENKKIPLYKRDGGRGISVCKEWHNFEAFYKWAMENGYRDDLTIDRIDYNGNYEPSNCRWTDNITQANNTRRNFYITYNGETHTLAEWSRILGFNYDLVKHRLYNGWDFYRAINTPKLK